MGNGSSGRAQAGMNELNENEQIFVDVSLMMILFLLFFFLHVMPGKWQSQNQTCALQESDLICTCVQHSTLFFTHHPNCAGHQTPLLK